MADEMKSLLEAVDRIEGKMSETAKSNETELKRLGDEQVKLARQMLELQQKGIQGQKDTEAKTAGDMVVDTDHFKAFRDGSAQKARVELSETFDKKSATNPITTPTGGVVQAYRRPGILPGAFRPLTIEGLFPSLPVTTNAFEYVQEKEAENVNGAAFVAEGAQKPFGSTAFETKTGTIKTIAHLARAVSYTHLTLPTTSRV